MKLLLPLLLCLTSCVSSNLTRLPASLNDPDAGLVKPEDVRICYAEQINPLNFPTMVPIAVAKSASTDYGRDAQARVVVKRYQEKVGADLIVIGGASSYYSGHAHSQYYSRAVYGLSEDIWFFRKCRATLGIRTEQGGSMVTSIREGVEGIQEGDTLVSVKGTPHSDKNAYYPMMLGLNVGEEVKVIFIRPGVGRMECTITAGDNSKSIPGVFIHDFCDMSETYGGRV